MASLPNSRWKYPPAINQGFQNEFFKENPSATVQDLMVAAVHKFPLPTDVIGDGQATAHVKDIFWLTFSRDSPKSSSSEISKDNKAILECVMCTKGRDVGDIYDACDRYTDTANMLSVSKTYELAVNEYMSESSNLTISGYSDKESIPSEACGICSVRLCLGEDCKFDDNKMDRTVPFPVLQEEGPVRWEFNEYFPEGVDSPEPTATMIASAVPPDGQYTATVIASFVPPNGQMTATVTATPYYTEPASNHNKIVKIVVPVVVVVFVVLAGLAAGFFLLRRKRNAKNKVIEEEVHEKAAFPAQFDGTNRRQSSEFAPPAYHEAVVDEKKDAKQ